MFASYLISMMYFPFLGMSLLTITSPELNPRVEPIHIVFFDPLCTLYYLIMDGIYLVASDTAG